jgi:uncharacterized glyoxalase superfamily protein PhnB
MEFVTKSLRTFIGTKNFDVSRSFYKEIGFDELILTEKMSYFKKETLGFYLQDYFVEDWVNNSMLFLEVENLEDVHAQFQQLDLPSRYQNVKLSNIQKNEWGDEFFLHDPSGVLWHIGMFK